jgi:two-component system nitrate/nitrite response regulator NarL
MEKSALSVLLIDDYPLFSRGMAEALASSGEFRLLGTASDEKTALSLASLRPDIAVLGLDAEAYNALDILQEIKYREPGCRVVMMLNSIRQPGRLLQAIRYSANGYLLRTISEKEFIEQMRTVAAGGMAASDRITSVLAERLRANSFASEDERRINSLTKREHDVLGCVASGMSNREISKHLGIEEGTVKVHVKHILKKLKCRSRVEVAVWASGQNIK